MLSFKNFKTKLVEFSNSASSQATGIGGSEGKAPGKGVSTSTSTSTTKTSTTKTSTTNTQVKAEQERHDNEDVKYVRDNLKYTKIVDKQTKTRIANHHNHK